MANKKQSKSVVAGSTRVLRPRTPTGEEKVDGRGMGKAPEASGKFKTGDAGKGDIVMKRKVMDDEGAQSRAKNVKAMHKNDMDKGAASGSTRVLRSGKEVAKDYAKAKPCKETVEADMPSAGKGSFSLANDFTGPEFTGKRITRSATKGQVAVQPNGKGRALLKPNNHMK